MKQESTANETASERGGTSPTDREQILNGGWTDCWICSDVFKRRTQTARFCFKCGRGFCEGWHGSFAYGHGTCVICGVNRTDNVR